MPLLLPALTPELVLAAIPPSRSAPFYLVFVGSWCGDCTRAAPGLAAHLSQDSLTVDVGSHAESVRAYGIDC